VGEAAVVANLEQKTANRRDRILQLGGKRLYHPAWLFREKGKEALTWFGI
jgi:hypothetical protein